MNEEKMKSFTSYMFHVMEELELEERFGTLHVYRYALRAFTGFVGGGEIFFGALSRRSLKLFERHRATGFVVGIQFLRIPVLCVQFTIVLSMQG